MATRTAHSEPSSRCLLPAPRPPPRWDEEERGWERKRARPHHSDSLWSHRHFHLLPAAPASPRGPATDVPPTARRSTACCWRRRVSFLDAMAPLRDPCGSVAATSAILSFASDAHVAGAVPPAFPCPPKATEQRSTREPNKPGPPPASCQHPPHQRSFLQCPHRQGLGLPSSPAAPPNPPPWPGEAPGARRLCLEPGGGGSLYPEADLL